jgi:hypothetical protein
MFCNPIYTLRISNVHIYLEGIRETLFNVLLSYLYTVYYNVVILI